MIEIYDKKPILMFFTDNINCYIDSFTDYEGLIEVEFKMSNDWGYKLL